MSSKPMDKQKLLTAQEMPLTNSNNVQPIYANNIGMTGTLNDVKIYFTELCATPATLSSKPVQMNEIRGIVTLPLGLIPQFIAILQQVQNAQSGLANRLKEEASAPKQ